ncbi:MAG: hypothetical protein JW990_21650, partial [Thermoleophilia bacterium]|nr:hypothetical protein [Thermoleophilia bacterium]
MSRPRTAAVISAVAASTAGFMVASRSNLLGTAAGAMLMPLVYTLVAHWSTEGLGCVGRWARRRLGLKVEDEKADGSSAVKETAAKETSESSPRPSPGRRSLLGQWLLAGFSLLALAVSIYAVAVPGPIRTVVVQERVIEKTITVTTESDASDAEPQLLASLDGASETEAAQTTGSAAADGRSGAAATETTELGSTQAEQSDVQEPAATGTGTTDTTGGEAGGTATDATSSGPASEQQGGDTPS